MFAVVVGGARSWSEVMYTFVNKGELDGGVVMQHEGGLYGSKGISQFGVGTCFCYKEGTLMCG
ncbi:unnamed protein product [Polarella glacialis]|uniref:Uncharacterized protein n=1 Tax=Polarella glacialis TaxID=89957 RepID=A0A813FR01_POLGL|nr:unnamed protein product [Polarella glacialis]